MDETNKELTFLKMSKEYEYYIKDLSDRLNFVLTFPFFDLLSTLKDYKNISFNESNMTKLKEIIKITVIEPLTSEISSNKYYYDTLFLSNIIPLHKYIFENGNYPNVLNNLLKLCMYYTLEYTKQFRHKCINSSNCITIKSDIINSIIQNLFKTKSVRKPELLKVKDFSTDNNITDNNITARESYNNKYESIHSTKKDSTVEKSINRDSTVRDSMIRDSMIKDSTNTEKSHKSNVVTEVPNSVKSYIESIKASNNIDFDGLGLVSSSE